MCHLEDKDHIGELSFLASEELFSPGIVAVTTCEVYTLTLKSMLKFREEYAEDFVRIKRILYERLEKSLAFMETHGIDVIPPYFLVRAYNEV